MKSLIERLATDVHDERTMVEHADAMGLPDKATQKGLDEVGKVFHFASSGYSDVRAFLTHQHTALGTPHLEIVRLLRNHVANSPDQD